MRKWITMLSLVLLGTFVLIGCGAKASEDKPIEEVKAEAAKMDADALKKQVATYEAAIKAKEAEAKTVTDKIGKLKPEELTADAGTKLTEQSTKLAESVGKLKERMQVYADELAKKGADALKKGAEGTKETK